MKHIPWDGLAIYDRNFSRAKVKVLKADNAITQAKTGPPLF